MDSIPSVITQYTCMFIFLILKHNIPSVPTRYTCMFNFLTLKRNIGISFPQFQPVSTCMFNLLILKCNIEIPLPQFQHGTGTHASLISSFLSILLMIISSGQAQCKGVPYFLILKHSIEDHLLWFKHPINTVHAYT